MLFVFFKIFKNTLQTIKMDIWRVSDTFFTTTALQGMQMHMIVLINALWRRTSLPLALLLEGCGRQSFSIQPWVQKCIETPMYINNNSPSSLLHPPLSDTLHLLMCFFFTHEITVHFITHDRYRSLYLCARNEEACLTKSIDRGGGV